MSYTVEEIKAKAVPIVIRYGVEYLSVFGSYARGEADKDSDIDFLIIKGGLKGLLSYIGMVNELEDIFKCHVDVVEKNAIKDKDFLSEICRDEIKLYEK